MIDKDKKSSTPKHSINGDQTLALHPDFEKALIKMYGTLLSRPDDKQS